MMRLLKPHFAVAAAMRRGSHEPPGALPSSNPGELLYLFVFLRRSLLWKLQGGDPPISREGRRLPAEVVNIDIVAAC